MRNGWHSACVGDLAESGALVFSDGYRTRGDQLNEGGLPILRVADVGDGSITPSYKDHVDLAYKSKMGVKTSRPEDVLVTTKGTVGRVARVPRDLPEHVYSPQLCFFRVRDPEAIDAAWLYSWARSPEFAEQADMRMYQTDMAPYLSLTDLRTFRLSLPSIAEQRAIARVLGALDDLIDANERLRASVESKGEALVRLMAQDGLDLIAGEAIEGWVLSSVGDVSSVLESGRRPKGGVREIASGVPSVGAESIDGLGAFDFCKTKYVPEEFAAGMRRGVLESRDVLVYKDGGKPGDFRPHVGMFGDDFPFDHMVINEHVYRVRSAAPLTEPYLYFWLRQPALMEWLKMLGTGAAIPGINSTAFKTVPVAVPPAVVRERLFPVLDALVGEGLAAAKEAHMLRRTRDELLPLLMSGEVAVREVAADVAV